MSWKRILFGLVVVIIAAGYLWKTEHAEQSANSNSGKILPDISADNIASLTIRHQDKSFTFQKETAGAPAAWVLSTSTRKLNATSIAKLITDISELQSQSSISKEEQESGKDVYGFENDSLKISLAGTFGEHHLAFGKKHPFSGHRYVQIDQQPDIHLVDDFAFSQINKTESDFYDSQPFAFPVSQVISVSISGSGIITPCEIVAERNGKWTGRQDETQTELDPASVIAQLEKLSKIKVQTFLDNPSENVIQLLSKPFLRIVVNLSRQQEGDVHNLALSPYQAITFLAAEGPDGSLYFQKSGDPNIVTVSSKSLSLWFQSLDFLRDKTPLRKNIVSSDVRKISLHVGTKHFELAKTPTDGSWSLASDAESGTKFSADVHKVLDWLEQLSQLTALSYFPAREVQSEKFGFLAPALEVSIETSSQPLPIVLTIGNNLHNSQGTDSEAANAPRYARVLIGDQEALSFVISGASWQDIQKSSDYFRATPELHQ